MSRTNAQNAASSKHVATMGPELGPLFHTLWQQLAWTFTMWEEHRVLFREAPARVEMLNGISSTFFYVVQQTVWESVLLNLCSLTAPAKSGERGKQDNVTILRLVALVDPKIRKSVHIAVKAAVAAAAFATPARNQYLAHRALSLMTDPKAEEVTLGSASEVADALHKIEDALDEVQRHYEDGVSILYGHNVHGAEALVYHLEKGAAAIEAECDRELQLASVAPGTVPADSRSKKG